MNAERKKEMNASSPSTPPVEGEAEVSQPSPPSEKVAAVSSERNSGQEPETKLGDKRDDGINGRIKLQMMFSKQLEPSDANPELNRAAILVHSYEMKKALSLTQLLKNIPYIRVLAIDPQKREYQLIFSLQEGGNFILGHEWGKLVSENGLKEGHTVMGYGNEKFVGNHFVVYIRIFKNPESCFLFEKKIERSDLKQLGIGWCSQKLKRDLEIIQDSYVRVLTEAPNKKVYNLSFSLRGDSYILGNEWENFVAENGLKEGDYVAALGARAVKGRFTSKLFFSKNEETNPIPVPMLFFEKELETADTNLRLNRLVIESCKEVVKRLWQRRRSLMRVVVMLGFLVLIHTGVSTS